MPRKFTAKAARLKKGVAYTGASSGLFDPGELAEKVLGDVHWGALMGYCWRRFGPPNTGSDPDKGLADWLITTPMEGLFLRVTIRPHSTNLLFGYTIAKDLSRPIYAVNEAKRHEARERYHAWCVEHKGGEPPLWNIQAKYGSPEYEAARKLSTQYWDEYKGTDAAKAPSNVDTAPLDQANAALEAAIADLKRPVFVRDVAIDALGVSETEKGGVERFHAAGYYFPPELLDDPELWGDLVSAVFSFGRGKAGVEKALSALKAASP